MAKGKLKARRSRYGLLRRITHSAPAMAGVAALLLVALVVSLAAARAVSFLNSVTGDVNPIHIITRVISAPPGSIAWKLQHGQQVHLLLLGYAGGHGINDAPLLTDSMMVASLDPKTDKVALASIPRDMWVSINPYPAGYSPIHDKINSAFEYGELDRAGKQPLYSGRDGGGHLAEATVGQVTGLQFDGYIAVDFQAFQQMVDAVGGVTVHLDQPLHDCHYPNFHDGYLNGGVPDNRPCPSPTSGISFPAGTYTVNGSQALELARSRHADNPIQASDFARAQRQQMIIEAIKAKALSVGGLSKLPQVLSALQNNITTNVPLSDLQAIYNFAGHLPSSHILHLALTTQNFLDPYFQRAGSCGPWGTYVLCPTDPTYQQIHQFFGNQFVPTSVLAEKAPVTVQEATWTDYGIQDSVSDFLRQLGFNVQAPTRGAHSATNIVYDYSGGADSATAQWMASYFGAKVVQVTPPTGSTETGVVVVLGSPFGVGWFGQKA